MKIFKCVLIFLVIQAFTAFVAWLGGFNFDQRNFDVAFLSALSIFVGAAVVFLFCPNDDQY